MNLVYVNLPAGSSLADISDLLIKAGFAQAPNAYNADQIHSIYVNLLAKRFKFLANKFRSDMVSVVPLEDLAQIIEGLPPEEPIEPESADWVRKQLITLGYEDNGGGYMRPPINDELRDAVAIAALQAIVRNPQTRLRDAEIANWSYRLANEMLRAREETR